MTNNTTRIYENSSPYFYQEALAAGVTRGRREEHLRACEIMREIITEIINARFPLIAELIQERVGSIESFAVLRQFTFIASTAWVAEDMLRFLLALYDAQAGA